MKKFIIPILAMTVLLSCTQEPKQSFTYPDTQKGDTVDTYFGTTVADPYRWLEDDNSEETGSWVTAQNKVTFDYLAQIPFRDKIKNRLTEIWDYPKISAPFKEGGYYFVFKNDGLQNQSVVYIKKELDGEESVILDPNKLSDDGTVALTAFEVSKDGKYIAYGVSRGGSDWREFYVRDIETGEDLADHLMWVKFSGISWYNNGFYYTRYEEPKDGDQLKGVNENAKIYYHTIGDTQDKDKMVYAEPDQPLRGFGASVTEDEKYLVITSTESTSGNALFVKDLTKPNAEVQKIITDFENDYWVVDHKDGKILVMTNDGAPKYRIVSIDLANAAKENWTDFIAEKENAVLTNVSFVGGKLIANYMKDAHSKVEIYSTDGQYESDLELPVLGTVSGFNGKKEDMSTFFSVTSFTTPSTVYQYDIANNTYVEYIKPEIDFDPTLYETKQVFYTSKDGEKIPMFIVHKKGLELDGNNPTLLYGYGGFNISLTPSFSVTRLIWLENNGVFAMATLRGGGEYGEEWHQAGTKMKKQNVFDDFIAAAEYLIEQKYTQSSKLTLQGGSNGGLLVGAVANQRPELFKVALPAVGVMDMLRYHKFTIGHYWASDYGTSEDSKEMFEYLHKYSPVHSIVAGDKYPATLVTTADHDDRVVPAHSFKYIATLQASYTGHNPVMIRIEEKAGHGAGKPTSKRIAEYADLWAFAFFNMDVTPIYE